jgi:hypothetical protein
LFTPIGSYYLAITTNEDPEFSISFGCEDNLQPDGWSSRYYGEKLPALSVRVSALSSTVKSTFTTLFTENKELLQEIHKCAFS